MLFRRIKAVGFLSHVETEVKLEGFDAVVVVGPNGVGKSSLMVDAPLVALFGKGRSGDLDGYIRNGKDMMMVEFDFALGDQLYRIVRKRSKKTARGSSSLEFYQIDSLGNVVRDLTAGSIGETESIIRRTIGTDFDTLVRSSIIEQGEADFFCNATPVERMELFSKVWDLEKYEDFTQMARDGVREAKERIKVLEERVSLNQQKIWEIEESAKEMESLKKQLSKESAVIVEVEKKKSELQKKIGAFDGMLREIEKAKAYQAQADKELKTIGDQHGELLKKIERYTKILKNKDVVAERVKEEKEKEELLTSLESKLEEAEGQRKKVDEEILEVRFTLDGIRVEQTEIAADDQKLRQMFLDADKLKGVQCHPEFDPAYVNEACRFIKDAVSAKKKIPQFEKNLKEKRDQIDKELANTDLRRVALDGRKKEINQWVGSCRNETKIVKDQLSELKKYTKLLPEISLAEQELPKLIEEEKRLTERCNDLIKQVEQGKKEVQKLTEALKDKAGLEKELQSVCNQLREVVAKKDELTKKVGFIEAGLAQVEGLTAQIGADDKEMADLNSKKALYQALEDAFRQIPYMLVSRGIGAVENIANEILGMISSSGLRVTIQTEKITKTTKKVKDEIHLMIQDADGEKQYKFLSGGEKLRVALALRLAIGEVFAHRRGVSVDSLLADEPFGPLDVEGIEDMKEAMRELKKRFGFMGVITHIEKAQDIFPTQIIFKKGRNGTEIQLSDESF